MPPYNQNRYITDFGYSSTQCLDYYDFINIVHCQAKQHNLIIYFFLFTFWFLLCFVIFIIFYLLISDFFHVLPQHLVQFSTWSNLLNDLLIPYFFLGDFPFRHLPPASAWTSFALGLLQSGCLEFPFASLL